jgi:hypothetical protein
MCVLFGLSRPEPAEGLTIYQFINLTFSFRLPRKRSIFEKSATKKSSTSELVFCVVPPVSKKGHKDFQSFVLPTELSLPK